MKGTRSTRMPPANTTIENFLGVGERSAVHPPKRYPAARPDRTTPMRLPHVQMELPKIGVTKRLPRSSRAITAKPDVKICIRSRRPERLIDTLLSVRALSLIRFRGRHGAPRFLGVP